MKSSPGAPARRLIVNADDFGLSSSVNQAVLRAHREGILTSASLMVNEPGCAEAVAMAREHPSLGVGLHLSLLCGRPALPAREIPGLVGNDGRFSSNPARVGWRYFAQAELKTQLRAEIAAQFEKFRQTGLPLDHVNGHLHLHLHPTIFRIVMQHSAEWSVRNMRLTRDHFRLNCRLAQGHWAYRISHAMIFGVLARRAGPALRARRIKFTDAVFGLLQNARVDEDYVARLLRVLPPGDSELYSHPSLDEFRHELDALISPRIRKLIEQLDIHLIRYRDL